MQQNITNGLPTLLALLLIPLAGSVIVAISGRVDRVFPRWAALFTMFAGFAAAVFAMAQVAGGPLRANLPWIPAFGVSFNLYVDGLSAILVLLAWFIGILAVLISWNEIRERVAAFHVWLLLLQTGILLVFMARDMMLFYFGWELMLVPMFFLIGVWGHEDKLYSAIKFFLFTFAGSVFMLVSLLYVYFQHAAQTGNLTFDLTELMQTQLSGTEQWWLFLGLFVGFAVKVPLFPLHTWLPDAHTQAPTAGSLILAGLLLKTGVYGLMRVAIPLLPSGAAQFTGLAIALAVFGIFYGAIAAFPQRDFKRLVAYSSISHMGFVILGLFAGNSSGYQGAVLQMVNHGLATGALFLVAGMLQERTHTRSFEMFGGLWRQVPAMGGFLLFFAFASLGIPGTGNFIGELYVIAGAFYRNQALGVVTAFGVLFAAIYSLRLFLATMHGVESSSFKKLADTSPRENLILGSLAVPLVVIGLCPFLVTAPLFYPPDSLAPQEGRVYTPVAATAPALPAKSPPKPAPPAAHSALSPTHGIMITAADAPAARTEARQ
jgi:NADH-quinone oxidoreductase subunit M